jgi:hypothetical protein
MLRYCLLLIALATVAGPVEARCRRTVPPDLDAHAVAPGAVPVPLAEHPPSPPALSEPVPAVRTPAEPEAPLRPAERPTRILPAALASAAPEAPLRPAESPKPAAPDDDALAEGDADDPDDPPLVATPPNPSGARRPPTESAWSILPGQSLRQVLTDWARQAGWNLIWSDSLKDVDYLIEAAHVWHGDFLDAVRELLRNYRSTPVPLKAEVLAGNRQLRILGGGDLFSRPDPEE